MFVRCSERGHNSVLTDPSVRQKYSWRWCTLLLQESQKTSSHHKSPCLFSSYRRYGNASSSSVDSWLDGGVSSWGSPRSRYSCTWNSQIRIPRFLKYIFEAQQCKNLLLLWWIQTAKYSEYVTLKVKYSSIPHWLWW